MAGEEKHDDGNEERPVGKLTYGGRGVIMCLQELEGLLIRCLVPSVDMRSALNFGQSWKWQS